MVAVGSDPSEFPPEFLAEAAAVRAAVAQRPPTLRRRAPARRRPRAAYPKLVVAGGHHAGFDAMCLDLADRIGADSAVVEGAGHEIQFTGRPLNEILGRLWRGRVDQHATIKP